MGQWPTHRDESPLLRLIGSPASRRVYEYAIDQFIAWYCSEPRLALAFQPGQSDSLDPAFCGLAHSEQY
jgi:hypothetical protein